MPLYELCFACEREEGKNWVSSWGATGELFFLLVMVGEAEVEGEKINGTKIAATTSVVKMCFTNEEGKKGGGWEVAENGPNPMAIAWKRNRHFLNIVCLIFAHFLV